MEEIYRFRPIESLLGAYEELSKQEIYFANPDQLNDPMEGYLDIFWQGDEIIWENFLINYLRCVSRVFLLYLVVREDKKLNNQDIPLYPYHIGIETPQNEAIFKRLKDAFFKNEFVKKLPATLSGRTSAIRRRELVPYLSFVHLYAINTVSDIYFIEGFSSKRLFYHDLSKMDRMMSKSHLMAWLTNRLEKKLIGVSNAADILFSIAENVRKQHLLTLKYNQMTIEQLNSNSHFLLLDFPERFIDKLGTLMYSDWYSASFLGNCTNSAVWGHYAQNHTGACLIFKPNNTDNQPTLNLTTVYGINGAGQPMSDLRPHIFEKMEYHHKHVEIDFFRSLGRAPLMNLNRLWYENSYGKKSICAEGVDTEEWRKQYWANFNKTFTVKLEEWSYEEEYRLVINGMLHDYSNPEDRKLVYDFRQLKGIIFGIKTSVIDKQRIIKILLQKCEEHQRRDLEFYDAYYDQTNGKINRLKLNII